VLPYCLFSLPPQLLFTKYQLRVISPHWACVPGMALSNPNPGAFRRFMCAPKPYWAYARCAWVHVCKAGVEVKKGGCCSLHAIEHFNSGLDGCT
jgi:hypothetical protein